MSTRRKFLFRSGAGLLSLGTLPPTFLTRAVCAQEGNKSEKGRVLVLVQLAGGNDGLNTVIPYGDDAYYRNRPGIGIAKNAVLRLDDYHGLHPRMQGFQKLFDNASLAIVQGVGYPNPDRSHFRSMDIWHSAYAERIAVDDGWVGRALGAVAETGAGKVAALSIGLERLPLALVSSQVNVPNVQDLNDYRLRFPQSLSDKRRRETMQKLAEISGSESKDIEFLRRTALTAYRSAEQLEQLSRTYQPAVEYPQTGLAQKLKLIAQVIASDMGTEIFFVSLDGFDTHSAQEGGHAALLAELSDAVAAFIEDLKGHGEADRVMVATFSEFGRRVKENGSLGTDHGAASQMFLISPAVKGGFHGKHPSLTDLEHGDLKFHTDFRSVYATILECWLGYHVSDRVFGQTFPLLDVLG